MIPRTKVTYGAAELARAATRRDGDRQARNALGEALRSRFELEHVLLAPSGRASLAVLLEACDRTDVVVPAYTCKAVVEACLIAGKRVRFVDAEADGFNMDVDHLEAACDATCVVLATHQFGIPCDLARIQAIAARRGALVVEDAAASLGTTIGGRQTGTLSDAGFFSFDSTKLVNVPLKGGFLTVRDRGWFERVQAVAAQRWTAVPAGLRGRWLASGAAYLALENHAAYRVFHEAMFARRARFTNDDAIVRPERTVFHRHALAEWQAAIALPQIERLDALVERRRELYARLHEGLRGARTFALPPAEHHAPNAPNAPTDRWACIRFAIRVRGDKLAFYRRAVARGLDFAFSFTFLGCGREHVNAWKLADAVLDVPYYHKLTNAELRRTIDVLRALDEEGSREN
jgi:dTDP-4-amino-4,6-dideoxygalactose transaminase